ncbi:helix-turn-helix domain-containing protein [Sediminispirochaeta bajacaliforniensis]|uniref:hypothetical protein n=1 Tax=Sediminispirochaeta bajacaliforniensis TaxID=148 RepID=UPI0003749FEE|nr:hypothetical protein [Sediminispirochaeta bajacaliforniensis]
MRFQVGLIAPLWSSERILEIAKEFSDDLELIPFVFERLEEIADILDEHMEAFPFWLLSGPLPFAVAKHHVGSVENLIYCRVTETGLLMELLKMAFECHSFLEKLSIDFIDDAADIEEVLNELGLPRHDVKVKRYKIPVVEEEILKFHQDLWESKAIQYVITTIPFVYKYLKQKGIPVYGVHSSRLEIRLSLELLIEKIRGSYFRNTQSSLVMFEIEDFDALIEKAQTPYKLQLLELKIRNMLLMYSEGIGGYLVYKENGHYEIFASRGRIEQKISELQDVKTSIALDLDSTITIGIGYGETVFAAQINAYKALKHSRQGRRIVVVEDGREIIEYGSEAGALQYGTSSDDEVLNRRLREAKVSIRTYRKIQAYSRNLSPDGFSAAEIAQQMGVTNRNVRRILAGLFRVGLVKAIGEESIGASGRPGRIYQFVPIDQSLS